MVFNIMGYREKETETLEKMLQRNVKENSKSLIIIF